MLFSYTKNVCVLSTWSSAQIQNTAPDFEANELYLSQNKHSICYYFKDSVPSIIRL